MMSSSAIAPSSGKGLLFYGAISACGNTRPPATLRRKLKVCRDVFRSRLTGTTKVDYRDYETEVESNVGDIAVAEAVRNHFRPQGGADLNVNWGELSRLDPAQIDLNHRLLLVAGSGYFLFSADGKLPQRLWDDLAFFERSRLPLVLYGVGVNHLFDAESGPMPLKLDERNRELLQRILARAALISVRDAATQALLSALTDKPVCLSGDPALFLHRNSLQAMPTRREAPRPRIGINLPLHGALPQILLRRNFGAYVEMLRRLQDDTGCELLYFMHSATEQPLPWLLRSRGVRLAVVHGDPYHLSQHYATLDLHIGGMLHSCILASGVGTPSVALAYDAKHQGFFDLIGLGEFCHATAQLDSAAVLASVRKALSERGVLRERIASRKAELSVIFDDMLAACATLAPAT